VAARFDGYSICVQEVTAMAEFWKWLWSDWGKPNVLTRAGIPRIVTNLFTYLLAPCVSFYVTMKFVSDADRERVHLLFHDGFFVLACAVFYVAFVMNSFLENRYHLTRVRADERFRIMRVNWKDPAILVFWVCFAVAFGLFLLGAVHFRHQIR
jgi:hypothetical protein